MRVRRILCKRDIITNIKALPNSKKGSFGVFDFLPLMANGIQRKTATD